MPNLIEAFQKVSKNGRMVITEFQMFLGQVFHKTALKTSFKFLLSLNSASCAVVICHVTSCYNQCYFRVFEILLRVLLIFQIAFYLYIFCFSVNFS